MAVPAELLHRRPEPFVQPDYAAFQELQPLPFGTFLDGLDTRVPRVSEANIPGEINLPLFFTSNLRDIYSVSHRERSTSTTQTPGRLLAPGAVVQLTRSLSDVEAGQNYYVRPEDGRTYSSPIVGGQEKTVDGLKENMGEIIDNGYYPIFSAHTHPGKELLAFPSLDDLVLLVQQRRNGESEPLMNAIMILGEGVQVMAQMTDESHALMTDEQIFRYFFREWEYKFRSFGGKQRLTDEKKMYAYRGNDFLRAKAEYRRQWQPEHDKLKVALTEELNPTMYISTDMAHFEKRASPADVMKELRSMETYAL